MKTLSLTSLICSGLLLSACGNRFVVIPPPAPAITLPQASSQAAVARPQNSSLVKTTAQTQEKPVQPKPALVNSPHKIEQNLSDTEIPTHFSEPPPLPKAKQAEIRLFRTFGTSESLNLKARVIKPESSSEAQADDSKLTSLIRNIKGFSVSEIADVRVLFELNGKRFYASSNKEGMIDLASTAFAGLAPGIHQLTATVAGGQKYQSQAFQVELMIHPQQDQSLGFISDIDDTIKISDISNKLAAAKKLLTLNPFQAKVMPGTSTLYQLLENRDKQADGDFFYLSGSPLNLSPEIYSFLDFQRFPTGAVELKKWGFEEGDDNPIQQENYKGEKLKAIFEAYPNKPFVLFGDSSEKDTEIYLAIAAEYPGRVKGIFINNVTADDPSAARFAGVHLTANAGESARILAGLNLLTADEVSQVEQSL